MTPNRTMLSELPFLSGMRSEHLKILADSAMESEFTAGERIFAEGEIANRFYLIQHGKVALEAPRLESGTVEIQTLSAGDDAFPGSKFTLHGGVCENLQMFRAHPG